MAFAVLGILAGLVAAGTIYYREFYDRPHTTATPEQTVDAFLTAVFKNFSDPAQTAAVVCDGWKPADAILKTRGKVPTGATVGWKDIRLLNGTTDRATVGATISLTASSPRMAGGSARPSPSAEPGSRASLRA